MDLPPTPFPTGRISTLELTGCVFAWRTDAPQPWLAAVEGSRGTYLPVFSTAERCRAYMQEVGIPAQWYTLKHIDDGREFLESIRASGEIVVIYNPRRVEGGASATHSSACPARPCPTLMAWLVGSRREQTGAAQHHES